MTQVITRIGDSMLSMLLPKTAAGAGCVVGAPCSGCFLLYDYCGGDCKTKLVYHKKLWGSGCVCGSGGTQYCYIQNGGYCC